MPNQLYPKMMRNFNKLLCYYILDAILYSDKQIYSDYHLNSIYIYYCCFWLFVFCYVIMYAIYVYCKFICIYMY